MKMTARKRACGGEERARPAERKTKHRRTPGERD